MNKKILVSAVATTLAVGLAPAAQADDNQYMLLPYVVKDANRTTVVTLMGSGATDASAGAIHLQYWTKSTTDANTAACQPNSVVIPFTPFDMVTFDTAGILGYPLFGDTTNPAPLGTGISYAAPRHGFLLAEGRSAFFMGGYWLELDLANGGAHGDRGAMGGSPNYSGLGDSNGFAHMLYPGDVGYWQYATPGVAFWPSSVASTAFTVTPGGSDMLNKENNQAALQIRNFYNVQGAYDRNENGVDGTVPITVRCVGRVTPAQLMPGVVANAAWAAQGGFGLLVNLGDNDTVGRFCGSNASGSCSSSTDTDDLPAMVYQVDSSSVGGKFMTNATRITTYDAIEGGGV